MPPRMVPMSSAQPPRNRRLIDLSASIPPSARNMPIDSIITTTMTMHMVTIGTN